MPATANPCRLPQKIARALARGLVALLMCSHALLALSSSLSLSHDPLRAVHHAHESDDDNADHGDPGREHEPFESGGSAHQHGHNPADHSHDKPNLPPAHVVNLLQASNWWPADEHRLAYPAPCASPERPPKRLPMV